MVLVSLTHAAAAVRMSHRGVLAQQLNAIESLASVDTICVDKTGTLTGSALRVVEAIPCQEGAGRELTEALAKLAAGASTRNLTLRAIADAYPADPHRVSAEVPFSSRRRWSAIQTAEGTFYLGAPGRIPVGRLGEAARRRQSSGRRVLAVAEGSAPLPSDVPEDPPAELRPLGVVVLAEELRPNVNATIAFLREQEVQINFDVDGILTIRRSKEPKCPSHPSITHAPTAATARRIESCRKRRRRQRRMRHPRRSHPSTYAAFAAAQARPTSS